EKLPRCDRCRSCPALLWPGRLRLQLIYRDHLRNKPAAARRPAAPPVVVRVAKLSGRFAAEALAACGFVRRRRSATSWPPTPPPHPGIPCFLTHSTYIIRNVILITAPHNQAA